MNMRQRLIGLGLFVVLAVSICIILSTDFHGSLDYKIQSSNGADSVNHKLSELAPAPEAQPAPLSERRVSTVAEKIVSGAEAQALEATTYTPGYFKIAYPNGDVQHNRGVCADVIVRSLRHAGFDLQQLIHEDMMIGFKTYPQKWGLSRPDPNIDHRRVPNQMCFFQRHGRSLSLATSSNLSENWQPGDLVYWKLSNGLDHCGVISIRRNANGLPWVIHNIDHCKEEDCLTRWRITGHFRFPNF